MKFFDQMNQNDWEKEHGLIYFDEMGITFGFEYLFNMVNLMLGFIL